MNQGMSAMGSSTRQGIDMAVSIINGLISGDMKGAATGALAPKIATIIKQQTEGNTVANTVSHAILGAVVAELQGNSALVGGLGAAASERGADVIAGILYPGKDTKNLSQEERQKINALIQLATGLAIAAAGGDIQDINTGVAAGKNAVKNNNLARAAWYLVRPSEIGAPVSINAVDVLMAEGLTATESKAFLESLNLQQRGLINLALVDPMGDGLLEDAVLKTYERYYNDYLKEKDGNKDNNTLTEVGSSSAGGASGLPPDDDDDKDKSKTSNKSESSSSNQQNRKGVENSWDKGAFDSPEGSLKYHFDKHGKEVGALTPEEYLHKAKVFSQNLKGARKVKINTPTSGVIRYYKNGRYIDKLGDKIISFGKQ